MQPERSSAASLIWTARGAGLWGHHGFYLPHSTDAAQVAHRVFITALMEKLEGMQLWTVWNSLSHAYCL